VAAWAWLPPTRFKAIALDGVATSLYAVNYRLAVQGTEYLGASAPPSPLQHYWSLAVEEQFYMVWPLLLLLVSLPWIMGWRNRPSRATVLAVLLGLSATSFALGVWQTTNNAPWAYFGMPFRAWELGVGAMIAVAAPMLKRMPHALAWLLSGAGLMLIVASAMLFDATTAFPGYAAALPVLAAAAVIAAGCAPGRTGAGWLLGRSVMQGLGKVSYSWYLWHWPVLVILPVAFGVTGKLGFNVLLAVWALALAGVTYVAVENPVRFGVARRLRASVNVRYGVLASLAMAVLAVGAIQLPLRTVPVGAEAPAVAAGPAENDPAGPAGPEGDLARLIAASADQSRMPANMTPRLDVAKQDWPRLYQDKCDPPLTSSEVKTCGYGDPKGVETVVVFGDSHAGQWFPALEAIAKERRWRLIPMTKNACTPASVMINLRELKRNYTECVQWRANVLTKLAALKPSRVIMSSNGDGGAPVGAQNVDEAWRDGWVETIRAVKRVTRTVVLIEDTPWPNGDVPDCVAAHADDVRVCARPRAQAVAKPQRRDLVRAAAQREGVQVIDPVGWFCTTKTCPPIIGSAMVFRDGSHVSATYASRLAPVLGGQLK
jgi:peptidoglycan/LPS O-acetylase OafA/YrhL